MASKKRKRAHGSGKNPEALTSRRRRFIAEYLIDLNAKQAAIRAGYSKKTAKEQAARLLTFVNVRESIDAALSKRIEKIELTADRVLTELSRMGFANMLDYIKTSPDGSAFIDLSKLTRQQAAAIQEITVDEYTEGKGDEAREVKRTRFKLGDKRGSLELLGKYLKLWTDKWEGSGPSGGPIPIANISADNLTDDQLAAIIAADRR